MMNRFVIPDIHGNLIKLTNLINQLNIENDDEFVFLGDYIDRGVNTKEVIEFLIEFSKRFKCKFLKGNHEQMLINSLTDKDIFYTWIDNGGDLTLRSYDLDPKKNQWYYRSHHVFLKIFYNMIPVHHLEFFNNLEKYYETDDYIFVHAGVNLTIPFEQNTEQDFLWIRPPFYLGKAPEYPTTKTIVFGHTPYSCVNFNENTIGLDLGACYKKTRPLIAFTCPGHSVVARGVEP